MTPNYLQTVECDDSESLNIVDYRVEELADQMMDGMLLDVIDELVDIYNPNFELDIITGEFKHSSNFQIISRSEFLEQPL